MEQNFGCLVLYTVHAYHRKIKWEQSRPTRRLL